MGVRMRKGFVRCLKWLVAPILLFIISGGCGNHARVFTIGVITYGNSNTSSLEGFKAGMAELGYNEGKDIKYLYAIITNDNDQEIDTKIKKLLTQGPDLILAMGKLALNAKRLAEGGTPVIFSGNAYPVETGLVKSLKRPEGNITGVKSADGVSKALEWLVTIIKDAKKIYMPYDPDDPMATIELPRVNNAASQLGIEVVAQKVYSVEEATAAIEDLPGDIGGVFMILSKNLNQRNSEIIQAAIKRGLPTGAPVPLDEDILITLNSDFNGIGRKTARLAQQIMQGVKPSDLPVETGDTLLTINLKTATKIGLNIPDDVLAQATTIIR